VTISWIVYALVVGALVATAARLLEGMLRIAGRPVRWIWAGALGLTIVLAAVAPRRSVTGTLSAPLLERTVFTSATTSLSRATWLDAIDARLAATRAAIGAAIEHGFARIERGVPGAIARSLGTASAALTLLAILLLIAVYAHVHRLRRRWPVAELLGERVRVSPEAGPAVIGLSNPEIVVPSWLLRRTTNEQWLVLVHEREHVRARDPLLLASACLVAALMPWNPAVWWMLSRLRLAVELDCDVRVLRQGVAPHPYGTLLIDLAEQCAGLRIGAPALADTSSHLEQRLLAMHTPRSRLSHLRAASLGAVALLALVAACEAKLPTSADVENMNVASAEAGARKVMLVGGDSALTYFVDGVKVTNEEALALGPERIGAIEVTKQEFTDGRPRKAEVHITMRKPGEPASRMLPRTEKKLEIVGGGGAEESRMKQDMLVGERKFEGVVIIDGVRASNDAMLALSPADIVSIEVIKGANAASLYPAPEAAKGVIKITTKKAGGRQ
jgi:beta-lactamase regulating signal transducer with metallopeptidase domain